MAEIQDIVMDTVISTLSERVDPAILRKADTKELRKKLIRSLTSELFFKLFKEGRLDLPPGFGSALVKEIKEKDKKVFDRKTGLMVLKHIKGRKVVYKAGDTVRELL